MRTVKIVADSSADVLALQQADFAVAPLKIIAGETEFVDDMHLDVSEMVTFFDNYKGRSKTSCPNPSDWLDAFGDAEDVFCVTITSGLSGSYNAACAAKQLYEAEYPARRVFVIDSLSAGPELGLIIEKLEELIRLRLDFSRICDEITAYTKKTGLLFMLESLKNFANNGRVSPAVAKLAGLLGIRIVGRASDAGQLEPLDKCRGEQKSLSTILSHLKRDGLATGKVRIDHSMNESAANKLAALLREHFPQVQISLGTCRGLCSYYAETGGMLVGFEKL